MDLIEGEHMHVFAFCLSRPGRKLQGCGHHEISVADIPEPDLSAITLSKYTRRVSEDGRSNPET